jgi:hypothetical protein
VARLRDGLADERHESDNDTIAPLSHQGSDFLTLLKV